VFVEGAVLDGDYWGSGYWCVSARFKVLWLPLGLCTAWLGADQRSP